MRSMVVMAALGAAVALATPASASGQPIPTGKLPGGVAPTHYRIDLEVAPAAERFAGRVRIDVALDAATRLIWMHGRDLTPTEVYALDAGGARVPATFTQVDGSGVVKLETETAIGPGSATLVIGYDAAFNQSLEGLYQVRQGGQAYAYTQFEALSARRAFPGFDEPRFKTPFDISVTVGGPDVAISNAPVRETVPLADGRRRVAFETTEPLPTYLLALAVGDFDVVEWAAIPANRVRAWPVPLRGIAPKGKGMKLPTVATEVW